MPLLSFRRLSPPEIYSDKWRQVTIHLAQKSKLSIRKIVERPMPDTLLGYQKFPVHFVPADVVRMYQMGDEL